MTKAAATKAPTIGERVAAFFRPILALSDAEKRLADRQAELSQLQAEHAEVSARALEAGYAAASGLAEAAGLRDELRARAQYLRERIRETEDNVERDKQLVEDARARQAAAETDAIWRRVGAELQAREEAAADMDLALAAAADALRRLIASADALRGVRGVEPWMIDLSRVQYRVDHVFDTTVAPNAGFVPVPSVSETVATQNREILLKRPKV